MDILRSIWKFFDYNRYFCAAVVVAAALGVWGFGCVPKTASRFTGEAVSRAQLNTEIERFNIEQDAGRTQFEADIAHQISKFNTAQDAKAEEMGVAADAAHTDLDRQDEIRSAVVNVAQQVLAPALGPYADGVFALLALGLAGDNVRKRSVIKRLKNGN